MNTITPKNLNRIVVFITVACACIVANLYYSQPILLLISSDIHLSNEYNGLITTLTQLGYALGVFLLIPLADILENKRLIIFCILLNVISLIGVIFSKLYLVFLTFSLILGISVAVIQILIPFSSYLTKPEKRGAVIGKILGGVLLGIMLARPLASFVTEYFGWKAIYVFSLVLTVLILFLSFRIIPKRVPLAKISYKELLLSIVKIMFNTPILMRRAIYQFAMFGVFSLFWTVSPQLLAGKVFGLSNDGIALFAFIGVGGAIVAPIAGKLADRGFTKISTLIAMIVATISFLIIGIIELGSFYSLIVLTVAGLLIDSSVSLTLTTGYREIYNLDEERRSRYNSIYLFFFFIGGAVGSSVGSYIYNKFGWESTMYTTVGLLILTILYFFTDKRKPSLV